MADGPCELAFAEAAQKDGVVLAEPWLDWLCEQGHLGIGRIADESEDDAFIDRAAAPVEVLGEIYYELGGDLAVRYACRANLLIPGSFIHEPTNTLIEIDEAPHFTSFRLMTLDRYPASLELGYDIDEYRDLCPSSQTSTTDTAATSPPRASASAVASASSPTATRCATSAPP